MLWLALVGVFCTMVSVVAKYTPQWLWLVLASAFYTFASFWAWNAAWAFFYGMVAIVIMYLALEAGLRRNR